MKALNWRELRLPPGYKIEEILERQMIRLSYLDKVFIETDYRTWDHEAGRSEYVQQALCILKNRYEWDPACGASPQEQYREKLKAPAWVATPWPELYKGTILDQSGLLAPTGEAAKAPPKDSIKDWDF